MCSSVLPRPKWKSHSTMCWLHKGFVYRMLKGCYQKSRPVCLRLHWVSWIYLNLWQKWKSQSFQKMDSMLWEPSRMEITHRRFLESMDGSKPQKDKSPPIPLTMTFGFLKAKENKKVLSTKNMVSPGALNITCAGSSTLTWAKTVTKKNSTKTSRKKSNPSRKPLKTNSISSKSTNTKRTPKASRYSHKSRTRARSPTTSPQSTQWAEPSHKRTLSQCFNNSYKTCEIF